MKIGEHDTDGPQQEQRASKVAMHSPTSSGVRQTRAADKQECWNPKAQARACPSGTDDHCANWQAPKE